MQTHIYICNEFIRILKLLVNNNFNRLESVFLWTHSLIDMSSKLENHMDNRPIELFGRLTDLPCPQTEMPWKGLISETTINPFKDCECPYRKSVSGLYNHTGVGTNCDKIRKAKPNPLIGNCVVRKSDRSGDFKDWIVCPSRFLENSLIFKDCKKFLVEADEYRVASELDIAGEGKMDFGLVAMDTSGSIADFVGIEVQACGTGGSGPIWTARNDYLENKLGKNYSFSLNQKDASKKILVQLLHKSRQIARWRKNTVLAIQDHFLEHLRASYNIDAHFHKQDPQDFIHIHSYKVKTKGGRLLMELDEALSTDTVGLSMTLISNPTSNYSGFDTLTSSLETRFSAGKYIKI